MTTEEFSNEFDTLLNSYSVINKFGKNTFMSIECDEYEKSVFLTKAQEDIIISIYNGKNQFNDTFEKTEEIRRYLSNLIKTFSTSEQAESKKGLSNSSVFYKLPEDVWFITYESVNLSGDSLCEDTIALVTPITQDDYYKVNNNPFRWPNERRVLRLDNEDRIVELISKYTIDSYLIRYITKPDPIILTDLPDNLSINGISIKTECKLTPAIHRAILERAIQLAVMSKASNAGKKIK